MKRITIGTTAGLRHAGLIGRAHSTARWLGATPTREIQGRQVLSLCQDAATIQALDQQRTTPGLSLLAGGAPPLERLAEPGVAIEVAPGTPGAVQWDGAWWAKIATAVDGDALILDGPRQDLRRAAMIGQMARAGWTVTVHDGETYPARNVATWAAFCGAPGTYRQADVAQMLEFMRLEHGFDVVVHAGDIVGLDIEVHRWAGAAGVPRLDVMPSDLDGPMAEIVAWQIIAGMIAPDVLVAVNGGAQAPVEACEAVGVPIFWA